MKWHGFLILLLVFGLGEARHRLDPLVESKVGLIRGVKSSDGDYSMFLGIPYAKVNDSNPFGASLPYPSFEETFNAFDDSAICPQIEDEFEEPNTGTLDCLHLNIYVPNTASSNNKLPVMVYIYGGSFQFGFGGRVLYGPKYLVRHNVILVTLNYRVGPYGFMCLDIPEVPGNQGLKDQVMALRWIKENIPAFGGDTQKVTIFGESAGGASVEYHLMSEQEPLFNKAITQSGTSTARWAFTESDTSAPIILSQKLGLETDDVNQAISFLSGIDSKLIIAAASEMPINHFLPCVEKDFEGVDKFVSVHPINAQFPKAKSIPILSGFNNDEQIALPKPPGYYDDIKSLFENILETTYDFGDDLEEIASNVRHFYIGDEEEPEAIKSQLIDFDSDFTFCHPVKRSIDKYLANDAKVYYYLFSYVGNRNFMRKRYGVEGGGASHGDELAYLFDISFENEELTSDDALVIERMTSLWTNFAKYGDPTPETSDLLPEKWLPVTKESLNYLEIDKDLVMGARPFHQRLSFWDLFFRINKKNFKGYAEAL